MRNHASIIQEAGGPASVRAKLAEHRLDVAYQTVRFWALRPPGVGSIPAEYWSGFVDASLATLEELAAASARKKQEASQ